MSDFIKELAYSLLGLFIMLALLVGIIRLARKHGPAISRMIAGKAEALIDTGA